MPPGPEATPIDLTADERNHLEAIVRKSTSSQRAVTRADIVLLAAEDSPNTAIAEELGISRTTVVMWSERFAAEGFDGLEDRRRSGCPPTFTDADRVVVYKIACELPHTHDLPLSKLSSADVHAVATTLLEKCPSRPTILDWLAEGSIKPWTQSSWVTRWIPTFSRKRRPP